MATKMDIESAFAELEAGKFSFRMIDALKQHVSKLETELESANALHDSAVKELRQREYTIDRLEAELRKVNAKIHALLRANALTDIAVRETRNGAVMLRDYLPVARDQAIALSKKTVALLATVDLKAEFEKAKAHPLTQKALAWLANLDLQAEWNKLQSHPLTEKARRELQPLLVRLKDYLPVAQKQIAALVDKASAYIASLNKKTA